MPSLSLSLSYKLRSVHRLKIRGKSSKKRKLRNEKCAESRICENTNRTQMLPPTFTEMFPPTFNEYGDYNSEEELFPQMVLFNDKRRIDVIRKRPWSTGRIKAEERAKAKEENARNEAEKAAIRREEKALRKARENWKGKGKANAQKTELCLEEGESLEKAKENWKWKGKGKSNAQKTGHYSGKGKAKNWKMTAQKTGHYSGKGKAKNRKMTAQKTGHYSGKGKAKNWKMTAQKTDVASRLFTCDCGRSCGTRKGLEDHRWAIHRISRKTFKLCN